MSVQPITEESNMIKSKQLKFLYQAGFYLSLIVLPNVVSAADLLEYLTDSSGKYAGPSVEDNIKLMDTDKNGFADVFEVRAFLELKHGKGYEKELLDKMESSARGNSCSTPFAKDLYTDQAPASKATKIQ